MHVISVTMRDNKSCVFLGRERGCTPSTLAVRRRRHRISLCLLSTGSPFGHHPRLNMVRLRRRREWICADAAEEERWYEHLQTYAIYKNRGRRNASTYSSTVPRGDTLCVTAGDAQRANPWKVNKTTLRHRRCRTAAPLSI